MKPIPIAIIGYGKIARDQHCSSISAMPRFRLVAAVTTQGGTPEEIRCFRDYREMLAEMPEIEAVAIATPPSVRYEIARDCLEAGKHLLIEKPPGVTIGEVEALATLARARDLTLFTTWHAQENEPVARAAELLKGQRMAELEITWHEDVRKWHPGQQWIWQAGGFGVFDPGINALSIATRIFPGMLMVRAAELFVPADKEMPIAAELRFGSPSADGPLTMSADWRARGADETWTIEAATTGGTRILLSEGGRRLEVNGVLLAAAKDEEYPSIYRRFLDLIDERASHVDIGPLRLVADAFLVGRRTSVEAFGE